MKTTATDFRSHLYQYLDRIVENGEPLEIERKGQIIRVILHKAPSILSRLTPRDTLVGTPEGLVLTQWSEQWNPAGGFSDVP